MEYTYQFVGVGYVVVEFLDGEIFDGVVLDLAQNLLPGKGTGQGQVSEHEHVAVTLRNTHTHTPVSYTHLTLPTTAEV